MDFITIYSTKDENEISILENVFRDEGVKYEIKTAPTGNTSKPLQKRIMVAEADKEKAGELLDQTGFLTTANQQSRLKRRPPNKYILIFLALLILLIVAILITWFMNVE